LTLTETPPAEVPDTVQDERVRKVSLWRRLLSRPELGSLAGVVIVWLFFAIVAGDRGFLGVAGSSSYLEVAAELGILAVPVALLMIGGEFDLSIGSIIGACGIVVALLTVEYGWPMWPAILVAFAFALAIGFINGVLVVKTGLPSFIITLGSLFVLRGLTIFITREITDRTQVGGIDEVSGYDSARPIFAGEIGDYPVSILWFIGLTALATWILMRTRFGNWTFGAGGDARAARNIGVPVTRVKIALFMMTAFCACLLAVIQVINTSGADTLRGQGAEFEAIIAAVIGGNLLTGGYGSAVGAAFGALIFGIARQGIIFAGWENDLFLVFQGGLLILAVLVNNFIRRKAQEAK
jgi:simple sugar transport system permease protein